MTLILILFVVWIGLGLLLGVGTLFLQGYLNETPPDPREVALRAPIAATVITVILALWCYLGTRNPPRWAPPTEFSTTEDQPYFKEMKAVVGKQADKFSLRHNPAGKEQYRDSQNRQMPLLPDELIVTLDGEDVKFQPDRDEKGRFKREKGRGVLYRDSQGRVMEEGYLGQVSTTRTSWIFTSLLINLFHGAAWFVAAWLLMRFSLWQAVAIMAVAWGTTTLFVLPPLLNQSRAAHERREREVKPTARLEMKNRRESLATLPPVSRVSCDHPDERSACWIRTPPRSGRDTYLEATAAGNSSLTLTS